MDKNNEKNIITNIHKSKDTYKNKGDIIYELCIKSCNHFTNPAERAIKIYNELCEKGIIIEKDISTNEKVNLTKPTINDEENVTCSKCGCGEFDLSVTYLDFVGPSSRVMYSFKCKYCGHTFNFEVPLNTQL